ncbi:MAG: hypothetical protein AAGM16_07710 [Pseudomonadota bacterium]
MCLMVQCVCFLQEGQIPDDVVGRLRAGITDLVRSAQLADAVEFAVIVVPEGQGWTAGAPSTTSVVSVTAPPIPQERRVPLLHALCDLWMSHTGCKAEEILATIMPVSQETLDATVPV